MKKLLKITPTRMLRAVEKNMTLLDEIKERMGEEDIVVPSWLNDDVNLLCTIVDSYNNIFLSIYEDYDENGPTQ